MAVKKAPAAALLKLRVMITVSATVPRPATPAPTRLSRLPRATSASRRPARLQGPRTAPSGTAVRRRTDRRAAGARTVTSARLRGSHARAPRSAQTRRAGLDQRGPGRAPLVVAPQQGHREHGEFKRRGHRHVGEHVQERQQDDQHARHPVRRLVPPVPPGQVGEEAEEQERSRPSRCRPGAGTAGRCCRPGTGRTAGSSDVGPTAIELALPCWCRVSPYPISGAAFASWIAAARQRRPDRVTLLVLQPGRDEALQRGGDDRDPDERQPGADQAEHGELAPGRQPDREVDHGQPDPDPDPAVQRVDQRDQGDRRRDDRQLALPPAAVGPPGHEQPRQQDGQAVTPGVGVLERRLRAVPRSPRARR